jgi:hypothetical protein
MISSQNGIVPALKSARDELTGRTQAHRKSDTLPSFTIREAIIMAAIPSRVYERLQGGIKRFQPILAAARSRDAGEADTSTIVKDILCEVFGYDKYSEITSEYMIKSTYCDLAVKLDGKLQILIEVKAIGVELKEPHVKQAVDYAANQGIEWVILTNAGMWRIYRVLFTQPLAQDLVFECDLLSVNPKQRPDMESLYLFAKEGQSKSVLQEYHAQRQAMSRHYLAAVILDDLVLDVIRRELRRLSPDVKIDREELRSVLIQDVLKRDATEGDKADEARQKISRAQGRLLRVRAKAAVATDETIEVDPQVADGIAGFDGR